MVAEIGRDDWRIIDLFSRKGGLYEESFKSWQDAAQFRSSLWADEEKLTDSPQNHHRNGEVPDAGVRHHGCHAYRPQGYPERTDLIHWI